MSTKSLHTEYHRGCPECGTTLYYNSLSALNLALRENKLCRSCIKIGTKTKKNHPEIVKRTCEFCNDMFSVIWKNRKQRFCSTTCMHNRRTEHAWTVGNCLNCGNEFNHRKKEKRLFCSNECNRTSTYKKDKLKEWGNSDKNHWKTNQSQNNALKTKLEKYGDINYNNMDKQMKTSMKKYGVPYNILLTHSNGITISKGQRRLYEKVKVQYPDAILEYYLSDVKKSVDIYIPSENKIIEFFGDYWHCNPKKYDDDFYHKNIKLTAKEVWKRDKERIQLFEMNGYDVDVVWESD